jgi:hypothetical protein
MDDRIRVAATVQAPTHFTNPVVTDGGSRDHGDPFVLRHVDRYYLFHTTDDGDSGISVHESPDLVHWTFAGFALDPGPPGHWAETDLWAPEVLHRDGTFYMYVAGTRMGADGEGVEAERRQGLARSSSPLGPVRARSRAARDGRVVDRRPPVRGRGRVAVALLQRPHGRTRFRGKAGSGTVADRLLGPDRLEGDPVPSPSRARTGRGAPTSRPTGTRARGSSSGAGSTTTSTAAATTSTRRTRSG